MSNQDKINQAVLELLQQAYDKAKMSPSQQQEARHKAAIEKAKKQQEQFQNVYKDATWTCEHCQAEHKPKIVNDGHSKRKTIIRINQCCCEKSQAVLAQARQEELEREQQKHIDWLICNQKWLEFDTDWTGNEQMRLQLERARNTVLEAYIDKRTGILISGPVGVGKSHLARAFYQAYGMQGKRASFYTEPDIVVALRKKDSDEEVMMRKCQFADVLVFDDIGAEKFNQQNEWLHYLLQSFYFRIFERRQSDKITFITTNLKSKEMRIHIGERAASRVQHIIKDSDSIIQLWDVPDYRAKGF